jgi:hypothetical protein
MIRRSVFLLRRIEKQHQLLADLALAHEFSERLWSECALELDLALRFGDCGV